MIPLRLYIKNFLSYGPTTQTINFEPYHLICLSGKNGHGKSAMLDAITWAVWGHARKMVGITKSDEGLLRLGQSEMHVALDFRANGAVYRVRREYVVARGKSTSQLDFGVLDHETGRFKPLTGKTIRDTQEAIIRAVGIDFEAFESSVFLRQGHYDAFSRKSPRERKEILANILGLGIYEVLRKRAVERGRDELVHKQHALHTCELLAREVETYERTKFELVQIVELHDSKVQEECQVLQQQHLLVERQKELVQARTTLHHLHVERKRLEQQRETSLTQIGLLVAEWRSVRRRHAHFQQERRTAGAHEDAARTLEALRTAFAERVTYTEQAALRKELLYKEQQRIERVYQEELRIVRHEVQLCEQQRQGHLHEERLILQAVAEIGKEHDSFQRLYHDAVQRQKRTLQLTHELEQRDVRIERYRAAYHRLTASLNQMGYRSAQLCAEQAHKGNGIACSWCDQPIHDREQFSRLLHYRLERLQRRRDKREKTRAHIAAAGTALAAQGTMLREEQRALQSGMDQTTLSDSLRRVGAARVAKEEERTGVSIKLAHLEKALAEYHKRLASLEESYEQRFKDDQIYQQLVTAVAEDGCRTATYAADHERYERLQQELARVAADDSQRITLLQELARQHDRRAQIRTLSQQIRDSHTRLKELVEKEELCKNQLAAYEVAERELACMKEELSRLVAQKEELMQRRGALEQAVRHGELCREKLTQEEARLRTLETDIADYTLLAQALGKDGIQGMLIEQVLPEIEHDANHLLAKLTDNQAQLSFESVRELKSGGMKETLEIKISDDLGIRPYELFSGGEAFRIDFALRLAISKFLARRAGTSIQTLIIDEGFGSQDEEGLHHIMESLYAIQDEFAKIIIVSHLPSMKEQFPVHFCVSKGPRGTTVQVLQQG